MPNVDQGFTGILIYAEAGDAPAKQRAALALLKQLYEGMEGVLSTQVLQAYCNVALKKLKLPAQHIRAGLDLHQTRSIAFYDALIVASAQLAGCSVLFSEGMFIGETMVGVRIVNPFA